MKNYAFQVVFSLILVLILPIFPTIAEEITEIHFVSASWEDVTNADGTGLCGELFRKVYEPLGIQVKFEIIPYARATNMVQQQQADVSVGVYLDEYDHALFSEWHYLQDRVLAIFKKGAVINLGRRKKSQGKHWLDAGLCL